MTIPVLSEDEKIELIKRQLQNIQGAIRSLVYFRAISRLDLGGGLFWKSTKLVHFEHFITSWSKCFGSLNSEDLHWKRILRDQCSFRKELKLHSGLEENEFKSYTKKLLNIRNRVVAHTDMDLTEIEVPNFDAALAELIFLYKELIKILSSFSQLVIHDGPACIEMWKNNVNEEANSYISVAFESTKKIVEYH